MDKIQVSVEKYEEEFDKKMQESKPHEQINLMNEVLETILEEIDSQMPKLEYKNIDNTPKHLLHMTEEDLKPKSPAVLQEEL